MPRDPSPRASMATSMPSLVQGVSLKGAMCVSSCATMCSSRQSWEAAAHPSPDILSFGSSAEKSGFPLRHFVSPAATQGIVSVTPWGTVTGTSAIAMCLEGTAVALHEIPRPPPSTARGMRNSWVQMGFMGSSYFRG
jgi:hypothetical protein